MDQYPVFTLYPLNRCLSENAPQFQIRAMPPSKGTFGATEEFSSLETARAGVRRLAEQRLAQAREAVAGWERQLASLDAFYANPVTPAQAIAASRESILRALRDYHESGKPTVQDFGILTVHAGYLGTRGLLVFTTAEFKNVGFPFTQADVDTLHGLVTEAGFAEILDSWNGAGTWSASMNVRLPAHAAG